MNDQEKEKIFDQLVDMAQQPLDQRDEIFNRLVASVRDATFVLPESPAAAPAADDFWADAEVIHGYSRKQAIEDGVLVCLSGPDYSPEADQWVPEMCAEAGFRIPIAMTSEVFFDCVDLTPAAKRALNDIKGRLWDLLYAWRRAAVRGRDSSSVDFQVYVVVKRVKPTVVTLRGIVGPGDSGEPVLTLCYPGQE